MMVDEVFVQRAGSEPLPKRVPRDTAAKIVTLRYFEVSPRTLERWPLQWRRLNGRAHCETAELIEIAEQMLAAARPDKSDAAKRLAARFSLHRQPVAA